MRPLLAHGAGRTPAGSAARAEELRGLFNSEPPGRHPTPVAFPADVQAEVLVGGAPIPWAKVRQVLAPDEAVRLLARVALSGRPATINVDPSVFGQRPAPGMRAPITPQHRAAAQAV